jgi:hypothetical protein
MVFYINYLKDLVIRKLDEEQSSSFQRSSCLYLIKAINQFEWRIPRIWTELYSSFIPKMSNPYKAVREKLANCLAFSLLFDIRLPNHSVYVSNAPKVDLFFDYISSELDKSINLFKNVENRNADMLSEEHKNAINFVQTLLTEFITYLSRSMNPIRYNMIKVFSKLCCLDNIAAQDEQMKMNLNIVRNYVAIWYTNEECSQLIISEIKKV